MGIFARWREKAQAKRRHQALFEEGQQAGVAMTAAVDAYLVPRLAQLEKNLLSVFSQRLLEIQKQKDFPPKIIAQIEFKIFLENIENFTTRLQDEVAENVKGWGDIAKQLDLQGLLRSYVASKADDAQLEMIAKAIEMAADAVSAIPGAEQFNAHELNPEQMATVGERSQK